jgi:hypothetical protein
MVTCSVKAEGTEKLWARLSVTADIQRRGLASYFNHSSYRPDAITTRWRLSKNKPDKPKQRGKRPPWCRRALMTLSEFLKNHS